MTGVNILICQSDIFPGTDICLYSDKCNDIKVLKTSVVLKKQICYSVSRKNVFIYSDLRNDLKVQTTYVVPSKQICQWQSEVFLGQQCLYIFRLKYIVLLN